MKMKRLFKSKNGEMTVAAKSIVYVVLGALVTGSL